MHTEFNVTSKFHNSTEKKYKLVFAPVFGAPKTLIAENVSKSNFVTSKSISSMTACSFERKYAALCKTWGSNYMNSGFQKAKQNKAKYIPYF